VNPVAGKGLGERIVTWLRETLSREDLEHEIVLTRAKGEATDIARRSDSDVVIAVGGDGTVNEIANGIIGSERRLGIIPSGSGNDLIKSLGIPGNPKEAFEVLKNGTPRAIDIGVVQWTSQEGGGARDRGAHHRCFVNGVGIGFDAAVAKRANSIGHLSGTFLYLAALLLTLGEYHAPTFEIVSGNAYRNRGRQLLIAIGNGSCAGGGFYLTPQAKLDDQLLDMCAIDNMSLFGILRLIRPVLQARHVGSKGITYFQGRTFSVSAMEPFALHADGEVLATDVRSVDVGIRDAALFVIAPLHGKIVSRKQPPIA